MADKTPSQTAQMAEAIRSQASNLANTPIEKLIRPDLGQASFELLRDDFEAMIAFARRMANCSWNCVPASILSTFTANYGELFQPIQAIQTFSLLRTGVDIGNDRNRLVSSFQQQWGKYYLGIVQHLCYAETVDAGAGDFKKTLANALEEVNTAKNDFKRSLELLKTGFDTERNRLSQIPAELEQSTNEKLQSALQEQAKAFKTNHDRFKKQIGEMEELLNDRLKQATAHQEAFLKAERERITGQVAQLESSTTNQLQKALQTTKAEIQDDQKRMKSLVAEIEELAKVGAITKQSEHFKQLADNYRKASIGWFVGAFLSGGGLYWYVFSLHIEPANGTNIALVSALMPRLITVTILSTALIFCLRNFAAMMHNTVVNRHRQTALTTFQVFVNGTTDLGTKNAVLVQSTQAIFTPQPSGYLKTDAEMPQISQITEIVRGATGAEK